MPVRLTPASRVVTGPRLRGTAPRARIPRVARDRRRVIEGSRAALLDEHSPRRIHPAHLPAPLRARVLVALGGAQAFCFNAPPRPAPPPPPARGALGSGRRWQAGDRPRHRRRRHRPPPRGEKRRGVLGQGGIRGGLQPGRQPGLQLPALPGFPAVPLRGRRQAARRPSPVARRRARYRSTVRSDTPNRSAARDWLIPASTAATIRSRKSIEYARTPAA